MTIIFYGVIMLIFSASAFIILFKNETGIIDAYFNEKYKKILDEAATLAAREEINIEYLRNSKSAG